MKDFWNGIRRLSDQISMPWSILTSGVLLMFLNSLLGGISITAVGPLLDRVLNRGMFRLPATLPDALKPMLAGLVEIINGLEPMILLRNVLIFLAAAFTLKVLVAYQQFFITSKFSQEIIKQLRAKVFEKYLAAPIAENQKKRIGERLSHFTYDIGLLEATFSSLLPKLVFNFFQLVVYFGVITVINWRLTLYSLFIIPAFAWPLTKIGSRIRKLTTESQVGIGNLNSFIQEGLINLPIVKAYVAEPREQRRFDLENQRFFRVCVKIARRYAALSQVIELITMLAGVILIYLGAREVNSGVLQSGTLMIFLAGLFSLFAPLKSIVNTFGGIQQAAAVFPRLFAVLDGKIEQDTGRLTLTRLASEIRFESVSFAYGKRTVLKNLSLRLPKGTRLGVVGESGTGKTTLINLLLRFYEPSEGRITIDGAPVTEYSLASYRKIFGLVTQEPLLFNDTVAANIAYGRSGASPEEIAEAARIANIHDLIEKLPNGYQTLIGDRGVLLSGGEKQRLSLARAVLSNPDVFILDEATSNLDSESERLVQEALNRVMSGRTCLVIAHRLSTLQDSDWIIVLDQGVVVEEGTHADLLSRPGRYQYLYNLQQKQQTKS